MLRYIGTEYSLARAEANELEAASCTDPLTKREWRNAADAWRRAPAPTIAEPRAWALVMQIAVLMKDSAWTVLRDGACLEQQTTHSAALEIAHALRFRAEAEGQIVEFVYQDQRGELKTRWSGD